MKRSGEGSRRGKGKTPQNALYGINPVWQCLLNQSRPVRKLFVKEGKASPRLKEIVKLARKNKVPVAPVDTRKLFDITGVKFHQGAALDCGELKLRDPDDWLAETESRAKRLIVALDQVEDPQNLGAIIRSAAYLGADALISLKHKAAPFSPAVSKASAGALEYFPVMRVVNLSTSLQKFQNEGFTVFGATSGEDSISFMESPVSDNTILVMGNEGQGLRRLTEKRCDHLIHIPGKENTESLNVSAAAAILIQRLVCKDNLC